jgi:hypothetical protein
MVRQVLLPFVPLKWERSYKGLTMFEVYKGKWRSGRGTSNVLRFYITARRKPVPVDEVTTLRPRPFVDPNSALRGQVSDLSALGQLLAERTGVPITFRTEDIDQPLAPD